MELLEIISYSLKIFCLTMFSIVGISYLIYKIKNKNKKKPYLRKPKIQTPAIKITFQKSEIDKSRLERIDSQNIGVLNQIPVDLNNAVGNISAANKYRLISYIPEENFNKAKDTANNNFSILDLYSADKREKMYKINS